MNIKNLNLIKQEYLKWDKIYKGELSDNGNSFLCDKYFNWGCYRCPIYIITGKKGCFKTPYVGWVNHQFTFHLNYDINNKDDGLMVICKECKKYVLNYINFLWKILILLEKEKVNYVE